MGRPSPEGRAWEESGKDGFQPLLFLTFLGNDYLEAYLIKKYCIYGTCVGEAEQ